MFTISYVFKEFGTTFEFVGKGECRSRCYATGIHTCSINHYYKRSSNIDECQLACQNEVDCTGFSISDKNTCNIYGNISAVNVDIWANPNAWRHGTMSPEFTFGYEGFKVNSSFGSGKKRCFRRLDEGTDNDGKTMNYSRNFRGKYSSKFLNLIYL